MLVFCGTNFIVDILWHYSHCGFLGHESNGSPPPSLPTPLTPPYPPLLALYSSLRTPPPHRRGGNPGASPDIREVVATAQGHGEVTPDAKQRAGSWNPQESC